MKGYMIRGQSSGVMHDRVFLAAPTEDDLRKALAVELALHGFDAEGQPRDRWVMVQETEIVGAPTSFKPPAPAGNAVSRVVGRLRAKQSKEDAPAPAPPATSNLGPLGEVTAAGEGSVINPGEPGHVPGEK